jgi:hypothetical protein
MGRWLISAVNGGGQEFGSVSARNEYLSTSAGPAFNSSALIYIFAP